MVNLKTVYNIFKRWLYIEDFKRIDIVLATALSQKMSGTPIWLILVGPSGDWKSEQIISLNGENSVVISRITDNTLISGLEGSEFDLVPKLDGKILLIPDFSSMLKLHPNIKAEVWAQMRELYDGRISRKTGSMKNLKEYKNFRVTLIAGATPAIDTQILIHQDLGTRELLWRTEEVDKKNLMEKVWKNEEYETIMREQLNKITHEFLKDKFIKKIKFKKNIIDELKQRAKFLTFMRSTAISDSYSGELVGDSTPEEPTRVLKQLKRIYIALKSLERNYPDSRALDVIDHLVDSSSDPIRKRIYHFLAQKEEWNTLSNISDELKIGKRSTQIQLNIMWNLGMVEKSETTNDYNKVIRSDWKLREEWR